MNKTASQLAKMAQGQLSGPDTVCTGAAIDSRQVTSQDLYIPICGQRADGHDFLAQVKEAGASCTLWQKDHHPYPEGIPYILVDDTISALGRMGKACLEELNPYVIAITGSNGKTSAKDMAQAIFSTTYKTACTPGNRNSEIGLPLSILDFPQDTEVVILEMGMENFGEISRLAAIAPMDAAIITSIGSAHMENLGSKDNIAKAKLEILEGLKEGGILLYHKPSREIEANLPAGTKAVSFGKGGDITAGNIRLTDGHMQFETDGTTYDLNTLGAFQCDNALPSIWLARKKGIPEESIRKALATLELTGMRMHLIPAGKGHILDDSYKSNPESAMAALGVLAALPGKHIAALGDMLDLGPEEKALHQQVLDTAKALGVEVHTTGPIYQQIGHNWQPDTEQLAKVLAPALETDTTILVKGSRAMHMEDVVNLLQKEGNPHE